jgi:hypothetical protein
MTKQETTHPHVFSALNSHASYAQTAFNIVYENIPIDVVGITIQLVDRTMMNAHQRWMPMQDNVVVLTNYTRPMSRSFYDTGVCANNATVLTAPNDPFLQYSTATVRP